MNLSRLVEIYKRRNAPEHNHRLASYRSLPSPPEAIRQAALGTGVDGRMDRHQRRIGYKILGQAADALVEHAGEIGNCSSFADILACVENLTKRLYRFGELACYDTSLRIGAKLDKWPEAVYLHAGTRKGCYRVLGLKLNKKYVEMDELPKELQVLEPHEAEDFLCIYKDWLVADG